MMSQDGQHVVIPIVAGIGNALMTVPMVRQLKRKLPGVQITIIARIKAMAAVFDRLPEVDRVQLMGKGALGYARGIFRLKPRPDVVIVPFPSNRWQYMMLALASRARQRIIHGYPVGRFTALGFIPATRLPAVKGRHDVVQNLHLLRPLGIEPDFGEAPVFPITDAEMAAGRQMLDGTGIDPSRPFIAIHPGSARTILAKAKRWPPDRYAHLARQLRQSGHQVVILEGPDEAGVAAEIVAHGGDDLPVLRLGGGLGEAAAVLKRAKLYVGSDSGLAHLAAAVGTAPLTLFAPADPDRVCPFGYRHLVIQPPQRDCPCFLYPWQSTRPKMRCRDATCISSIPVELVLERIDQVLKQPGADAAGSGTAIESS